MILGSVALGPLEEKNMAGAATVVTLFVLTAMPAGSPFEGGMSSAYTNKDNLEACQASIEPVKEILVGGGVEVVTMECLKTSQPITQFKHRPPKDAKRRAFLNRINGDQLMIIPQETEKGCQAAYPEVKDGDLRHYCSTSKQNLVK